MTEGTVRVILRVMKVEIKGTEKKLAGQVNAYYWLRRNLPLHIEGYCGKAENENKALEITYLV